jgi:hypothetical protein
MCGSGCQREWRFRRLLEMFTPFEWASEALKFRLSFAAIGPARENTFMLSAQKCLAALSVEALFPFWLVESGE